MLEFVNELLDSKDNIIDQLLILKENKNNKEVKKYINALLRENNSPYFKYCIDLLSPSLISGGVTAFGSA